MDIRAYIASGVLEQYVLGLATPEETKEVEELILKHPEIQAEIAAIQQALESYAQTHRVQPPEHLREKILRIGDSPRPAAKAKAAPPRSDAAPPSKRESDKMNVGAIAALLLGLAFLGAAVAAFLFYRQAENSRQSQTAVQSQFDQYKKDCEERQRKDEQLKEQFIAIRHWATKAVQMKGTPLAKEAFVIVYWNDEKDTSFLDVINLPTPSADKQYQLWAIVNGQPTDMGVFDLESPAGLRPVPFIENPQAFAVTLEPKGGSPSPTLDQMYVIGNLEKG